MITLNRKRAVCGRAFGLKRKPYSLPETLSILTENRHFGKNVKNVKIVKNRVRKMPEKPSKK